MFPINSNVSDLEYTIKSLSNLKGLSIAYLNICSVVRKFDDIRMLLEKSNLDVFVLGETFLNTCIDETELNIPGYSFIHGDRSGPGCKSGGGGLLAYLKDKLEYEPILNKCTPNLEGLWFTISLQSKANTNMWVRPPNASIDSSIQELELQLELLEISLRHDIVILGDNSIDFASTNTHKTKLNNFLKSVGLTQTIDRPMGITVNTTTCIDHIYLNNTELFFHCGVINPGLSDHCLVFVCCKCKRIDKSKKTIHI